MKIEMLSEARSRNSGTRRKFGHVHFTKALCVSLWIAVTATTSSQAGSASSDQTASSSITESSTRYGLFGWFDHRSDKTARDDVHWSVVTSLVFEY